MRSLAGSIVSVTWSATGAMVSVTSAALSVTTGGLGDGGGGRIALTGAGRDDRLGGLGDLVDDRVGGGARGQVGDRLDRGRLLRRLGDALDDRLGGVGDLVDDRRDRIRLGRFGDSLDDGLRNGRLLLSGAPGGLAGLGCRLGHLLDRGSYLLGRLRDRLRCRLRLGRRVRAAARAPGRAAARVPVRAAARVPGRAAARVPVAGCGSGAGAGCGSGAGGAVARARAPGRPGRRCRRRSGPRSLPYSCRQAGWPEGLARSSWPGGRRSQRGVWRSATKSFGCYEIQSALASRPSASLRSRQTEPLRQRVPASPRRIATLRQKSDCASVKRIGVQCSVATAEPAPPDPRTRATAPQIVSSVSRASSRSKSGSLPSVSIR